MLRTPVSYEQVYHNLKYDEQVVSFRRKTQILNDNYKYC